MRDDINEKGLSRRRKCTTVLHGGVFPRTLTPHKSENKSKRKKKNGTMKRELIREKVAHNPSQTCVHLVFPC